MLISAFSLSCVLCGAALVLLAARTRHVIAFETAGILVFIFGLAVLGAGLSRLFAV